jgi:phosphomannomutase/phosphoglucomutase
MKFSLPFLSKSGKTNGEAAKPKPKPSTKPGQAVEDSGSVRHASLGKAKYQILIAGVLLLGMLALFVYQFMSITVTRALAQDNARMSEQAAAQFGTLLDFYTSTVEQLAKDPDIASLLMAGDASALRQRENSIAYLLPRALNIQLLQPGIDQVDMNASPPLSYAALAQMREAERSESAPPAEVQLLNTPQQHINIVHRVVNPTGDVVGLIMLSLSSEVIQRILEGVTQPEGYLELQQLSDKGAPVAVGQQGDKKYKEGQPGAVQAVPGSRWQIAYWPVHHGATYLGKISLVVLVMFLVAAAVMAAVTLVLFNRLMVALSQDQVSLVTLMKDFRDEQVRREYPHGLDEMQETLEFMTGLAGGYALKGNASVPADRERDAEYAATQEQIESATTYFESLHVDNLIVEEDPLDFEPAAAVEEDVEVDASIFRAYDIRGVVNRTLTEGVVKLIGRAIGSEALQRGRRTVIVGRDGRLSGPALSRALIEGLMETGCEVKDIGCVPTPVLYFATHYLDTQTGVIVTGSHNPPDYNGLKIVIDGESLSGESIQHLRERIEARNFISGKGDVESINVVPDYIERIRGDVVIGRPFKVVVDCGNGVAGNVIPQLLKEFGCKVIELYCEVDGNFPNHHPDPSKPDNLKDLIRVVKQVKADVGLAFDGDGDRLGVITTEGSIVWADRVLMLFAADVLDRNPGGLIIYDVKCSRFLDTIIREHGGEPLMWKTGHSFIKTKMKETGALLAGEMSGHIFFKERWYGFDDGLYAAVRLLELLGKDDRQASRIFDSLPESVSTPEINIGMQEGEPPQFMDRLLASAHFEGARVATIDGLRADFDDGWGLVRASNTTPVLVLRFEADNDAALARIMEEFRRVMLQVEPALSLPF